MKKRCCFCGKTKKLEKHHIIPKSLYPQSQIQTYICGHCHDQLHYLLSPVIDYLMLVVKKLAAKSAEKDMGTIKPIGFVRTNGKGGKKK